MKGLLEGLLDGWVNRAWVNRACVLGLLGKLGQARARGSLTSFPPHPLACRYESEFLGFLEDGADGVGLWTLADGSLTVIANVTNATVRRIALTV